jgi:hypothetical protein
MSLLIRVLLLLGLAALAGCGPAEQRVHVWGEVTLNGEPLESGRISFRPSAGTQSPTAGGLITAGRYEIPRDLGPAPGTFEVEIWSPQKTGKQVPAGAPAPPGTLVDEVKESVPARYNQRSTLTVELQPGDQPRNFALTSP